MKIASSQVSMASSHQLESKVSVKKASMEVRAEAGEKIKKNIAAIYKGSGGDMVSALEQYRKQKGGQAPQKEQPQQQSRPPVDRKPGGGESCPVAASMSAFELRIDEKSELKIKLLNRLLEALNGKTKLEPVRLKGFRDGDVLDLRGPAARTAGVRSQMFGRSEFSFSASVSASITVSASAEGAVGTTSAGTLWQRVNATSVERSESEYTAFRSKGCAVTEDGRSINFDVELAMSRSFTSKFDSLSSENYILTDPLVINLDSNTTSVSDVKFRFDLDGDGEEENVSFAGKGSGFLALDRDGNGKIDNGSELFGTKSGNGFADLAAYDEDGNHWIDENDAVYSQLRVWVKDEDGSDRLMDLKEANVGAIYLGSVSTEFSLNDAETNETNAVIRKTGVYLKETGEVGTISHVDLRC